MSKGISYSRRIAVLLLAMLMVFQLCLTAVYAEEDEPEYNLESIKTEVTIDDNNIYAFKEVHDVTAGEVEDASEPEVFTYIRKLPEAYIGRVENVSVKGYDFYFDEEKCLIRIQNVEKGNKNFTIQYTVNGINNMGKKKDKFDIYFLNGSECTSNGSLKEASFKLVYSSDLNWEKLNLKTGKRNSMFTRYGSWKVNEEKRTIRFSNTAGEKQLKLKKGLKVSVHAVFPKGFWANATEIGWTKTTSIIMFVCGILLFIIMRIMFGRDKPMVIRKMPLPPFNMSPLQLGYIVDGYVDNRDIISQLFYMAQKGFWRIREYDRGSYEFEYVKYPDGEDQATKLMFNAVFSESSKPGDIVKLKDAAKKLKKVVPSVRRKTARIFRGGRAAFTTSSKLGNTIIRLAFLAIIFMLPMMNYTYQMSQDAMLEIGIILAAGFALALTFLLSRVSIAYMRLHRKQVNGNNMYFIIWSALYATTSIVYVYMFRFAVLGRTGDMQVITSASIFLLIAPLMLFGFRSRSSEATEILGGVSGFIEFIRETKGAELEEASSDIDGYFYRILPYAYQFAITKKVASNFQLDTLEAPAWYKPYGCKDDYLFDVVIMNSMFRNFEQDVAENIFTDTINYVF